MNWPSNSDEEELAVADAAGSASSRVSQLVNIGLVLLVSVLIGVAIWNIFR